MMPKSNVDLLMDYLKAPPQRASPANADVAKYILGAETPKNFAPVTEARDEQPSLMGKIFNALSVGNYAMAGFVNTIVEEGSPSLGGLAEGIQEQTTFSDVLGNAGVEDNALKSAGGLALDIFADPLTYAGGLGLAKLGEKARRGFQAPPAPQMGEQLKRADEVIDPEAFAARGIQVPEGLTPPARGERPRAFGVPVDTPSEDLFRAVPEADPRQSPISFAPNVPKPLNNYQPPIEGLDDVLPSIKGTPERTGKTPAPVEGQRLESAVDLPPLQLLTPTEQKKFLKSQGYNLRKKEGRAAKEALQERGGMFPVEIADPKAMKSKGQRSFRDFNKQFRDATKTIEGVAKGQADSIADVLPVDKSAALKGTATKHTTVGTKIGQSVSSDAANGAKQYNMYQASRSAAARGDSGLRKKSVDSESFRVLVKAEEAAKTAGKRLEIDGQDIALSDVIMKMGGPKVAGPIIKDSKSFRQFYNHPVAAKAIADLKAAGAMSDAPKVSQITDAASQALTNAQKTVPPSQMKDFEKFVKNFSTSSAKADGLSESAVNTTDNLIKQAIKSSKPAAELATESRKGIAKDIINSGKNNPGYAKAVHHALEKDIGNIPKWAINDNKVIESVMGRVATAFGQRDLRPLTLNQIGSAQTTAVARGDALANIFKGMTPKQHDEVFKLAQGVGAPTSDITSAAATQIKEMMNNLFSRAQSSALMKSAVTKDMLNRWMDHFKVGRQFSDSAEDITGKAVDHWSDSWKTWNIDENQQMFIFKVQQAMEMAVRERSVYDDLANRFGSTVRGNGYVHTIDEHPYLRGWYFPKDIAKQIPRMVRDWHPSNLTTAVPMLRHYDRVLSMWKAGVTIYRPGHHIRNMAGDVYLGWMGGVNSVRPYKLAARVQRYAGGYQTLADIDRMVDVGLMPKNLSTPQAGEKIFSNKSGAAFTADEVYANAFDLGLLERTKTLEDLMDLGEEGSKYLDFKPLGGKAQKVARTASELQAHNARLAHFIDKAMKSRGKDKRKIFENAAREARKWHPTGLDLTKFERKVMRRLMPFYSWMRKSTPLLLEGAVMNPGKVTIPAKINEAIQGAQGIETHGRADPFPVDQMFPSWIRHHGLGPVDKPDGILSNISRNMPPGYTMAGVGLNPLTDLMVQAEVPGKSTLGSITPALKVPTELLAGKEFFTGAPISGPEARSGALQEYIGQQVPIVSGVQGMAGVTPFGTETRQGASSEKLINFLTAAGIRGTGPYIDSALYEKIAPRQTANREKREAFYADLRRRLEGGSS